MLETSTAAQEWKKGWRRATLPEKLEVAQQFVSRIEEFREFDEAYVTLGGSARQAFRMQTVALETAVMGGNTELAEGIIAQMRKSLGYAARDIIIPSDTSKLARIPRPS